MLNGHAHTRTMYLLLHVQPIKNVTHVVMLLRPQLDIVTQTVEQRRHTKSVLSVEQQHKEVLTTPIPLQPQQKQHVQQLVHPNQHVHAVIHTHQQLQRTRVITLVLQHTAEQQMYIQNTVVVVQQ